MKFIYITSLIFLVNSLFAQNRSTTITTKSGHTYQRSVLIENMSNSRNSPITRMDLTGNTYQISILNDHLRIQKLDPDLNLVGTLEYDLGVENFKADKWFIYFRDIYFFPMGDKMALILRFEDTKKDLYHRHIKFFDSEFKDVTNDWQFITTSKGSGFTSASQIRDSKYEQVELKNFSGSNAKGVYTLYYQQIENELTYTLKWYDNNGVLKVSEKYKSDLSANPMVITNVLLGEDNTLYLTSVDREGLNKIKSLGMDGLNEEDELKIQDKHFYFIQLVEHGNNLLMIGHNDDHNMRAYLWKISGETKEILLPQISSLYVSSMFIKKTDKDLAITAIMWSGEYEKGWIADGNIVIGNYLYSFEDNDLKLKQHAVINQGGVMNNTKDKLSLQKEMIIDDLYFNEEEFYVCYRRYKNITYRSKEPLGTFTYYDSPYVGSFDNISGQINLTKNKMVIANPEPIARYFDGKMPVKGGRIKYSIAGDHKEKVPAKMEKKSLICVSENKTGIFMDYIIPLDKIKKYEFLGARLIGQIMTNDGHTNLYFKVTPFKSGKNFFFARFTVDS